MVPCRLCTQPITPPPEEPFDICLECATTLGVVPMPPPRRPARPCMRCNGLRFVRAIPREYTARGSDHVIQRVAPMQLTATPDVQARLFFSGNSVSPPDIATQGHGMLEAYACLGCGYVEWYCLDPEQVPIGPEYMTEIFDLTPQKPYR